MPREESFYPADWLRIAEKDLGRVERLLSIQDPEVAGFYLQQAVEKLASIMASATPICFRAM